MESLDYQTLYEAVNGTPEEEPTPEPTIAQPQVNNISDALNELIAGQRNPIDILTEFAGEDPEKLKELIDKSRFVDRPIKTEDLLKYEKLLHDKAEKAKLEKMRNTNNFVKQTSKLDEDGLKKKITEIKKAFLESGHSSFESFLIDEQFADKHYMEFVFARPELGSSFINDIKANWH